MHKKTEVGELKQNMPWFKDLIVALKSRKLELVIKSNIQCYISWQDYDV